jgi:hypothetical protein
MPSIQPQPQSPQLAPQQMVSQAAYGQTQIEVAEENGNNENGGRAKGGARGNGMMPAMPISMAAPGPEKEPPIGPVRLSTIGGHGTSGMGSYAAFMGAGRNVQIHPIRRDAKAN